MGYLDSLRYVIVPANEISQEKVDVCLQTSLETLRYNIARDKVVMKYQGTKPELLNSYTDYSHSEIKEIMGTDEWSKEKEL